MEVKTASLEIAGRLVEALSSMARSLRMSKDEITTRFGIAIGTPVREALECVDRNGEGVALVLDPSGRLVGIVTDGDLRRAALKDVDLSAPIEVLFKGEAVHKREKPLTAPVGTPGSELLSMMNEHVLRHIPLVEPDGRVGGIALMRELARDYELPLRAVVMAGGFGSRLRPLTDSLPKPMLPLDKKPVMEHIIEQLRGVGIRRVSVTTHYKAEAIRSHFGDGSRFGIELEYTEEPKPLGTAGALTMLREAEETLLVLNADILSSVDFRMMLDFHRDYHAELTIGVRQYDVTVPYGVVETDGERVKGLVEKPSLDFFINAGIYVLEPEVLKGMPVGEHTHMTDLIQRVLDGGGVVTSFPIREYWIDIGRPDDYARAQQDIAAGRHRI